ncbi:MAG: hypothetical protein F6K55_00265 [Moorea sp. SIO4A3]|nr:hypothetical protein [Moorena sp. SIO4A3]
MRSHSENRQLAHGSINCLSIGQQSLTQWGLLADAQCAAGAGSPVPFLHQFQY